MTNVDLSNAKHYSHTALIQCSGMSRHPFIPTQCLTLVFWKWVGPDRTCDQQGFSLATGDWMCRFSRSSFASSCSYSTRIFAGPLKVSCVVAILVFIKNQLKDILLNKASAQNVGQLLLCTMLFTGIPSGSHFVAVPPLHVSIPKVLTGLKVWGPCTRGKHFLFDI